ncbi:MAG: adenylyltransferase/cytidyltransferase family protein [bacterium]
MNRKIVMVFGSFDVLHKGHLDFFRQAKQKGDYLIVVLARDKTIKKVKSNHPLHKEKSRKLFVSQSSLVNKAILGSLKNKYEALKKYRPDVICLGYDQRVDLKELKNKIKEFGLETKVYRLKPFHPEIYKSSKLKS